MDNKRFIIELFVFFIEKEKKKTTHSNYFVERITYFVYVKYVNLTSVDDEGRKKEKKGMSSS